MSRLYTLALAFVLAVLAATSPAHAQLGGLERTAIKEGFKLKPGTPKILVFRPEVAVGEQTTGGMNEPNAEWSEQARAQITAALDKVHGARGSQLVMVTDSDEAGELGPVIADYSALFGTVAQSALSHKMVGYSDRLPTKRDRFDWTLGKDTARLRALGGDYGLFLYTYDSYGSSGRKVIQGLALVLGMGFVPSGVHVGYAGLVDLDTGDLVWLNVDTQMGGDVRTQEGAEKRVAQLMEGFPIRADGTPMPEYTLTFDPAADADKPTAETPKTDNPPQGDQ